MDRFPTKVSFNTEMSQNFALINIFSGSGLVPSSIKPLPEPMLTNIYYTIFKKELEEMEDIIYIWES